LIFDISTGSNTMDLVASCKGYVCKPEKMTGTSHLIAEIRP